MKPTKKLRKSCDPKKQIKFNFLSLLTLLLLSSFSGFAQAPVNDLCGDAIVLNCGDTVSGDTTMSTNTGDPMDACGTTNGSPGNWYSFTGNGEVINLSLCGSAYDTKIRVYSGDCSSLTCIGGNDDSCGLQSEFGFLSDVGTEYLIYVFGFDVAVGAYDLTITCTPIPPPPVNDECADAIVAPVNSDQTCTTTTAGTIAGGTASAEPNGCAGNANNDVWFQFVATDNYHGIELNNVVGNTTDLYHILYEGPDCSDLTQFNCSDANASLASGLTIGNTYYIRVFTFGNDPLSNTTFDLCITTFPFPDPCNDAEPFCSQEGLIFENDSSGTLSPEGVNYECLATQPNPTWFFLRVDGGGDLDFEIVQNTMFDVNGNPTGTPLDVDFIAWGPFNTANEGCEMLGPQNSIACSYSPAPIENFSITGAANDEVYVLLITNFSGLAGFISLQQTNFGDPGSGSTDCTIIPCSVEIDGGDQTVCGVPNLELTTTISGPVETYEWYQDDILIAGQTGATITVTDSATYRVVADGTTCDGAVEDEVVIVIDPTCDPMCSIIDFEENFGTGTGLECDLSPAASTYDCWDGTGQMDGGEYVITNSADGLNAGWHQGMEDHTEGDVDGRMLFINADDNQTGEFYRRTITLNQNTDYEFSAWITTVYDTDTGICTGTGIPSNVNFRIEDPAGVLIMETNTGDIQNGPEPNWQEFFIAFNTGVNTDIQLVLINNITGACGNDLAIDDITLTLENTQPVIVAPDDINACDPSGTGVATFDLNSIIDTVLDGQNAADFTVTFHTDPFEADAGSNPIVNPAAFNNTTNPQTIYVRVETADEPNCFSIVEFDLIVDEQVALGVAIPPNVNLCSTDTFPELDATPQNPDVDLTLVTYEWTNGFGTVVSTIATYTPTEAGVYTVTVSYPPCSLQVDVSQVVVTTLPTLTLGEDQALCDNGMYEIIPEISGNPANVTYEWSTGDTSPTLVVDVSGTYDLTITVGACTVTDSIDVFISDPITVEVTDDFRTCPGMLQTITATASDENASYQWLLNGEPISGANAAAYEFTIAEGTSGIQTYTVVATVGDCSGENDVIVELYDIGNCVISEGLSPDGSPGMNDSLDLEFLSDRTGGITKLQIFNRLGALIFEQGNYINEWAGQDKNGNELPTGTYYYVIDFVNPDDVYGPQASGWIYLNRASN